MTVTAFRLACRNSVAASYILPFGLALLLGGGFGEVAQAQECRAMADDTGLGCGENAGAAHRSVAIGQGEGSVIRADANSVESVAIGYQSRTGDIADTNGDNELEPFGARNIAIGFDTYAGGMNPAPTFDDPPDGGEGNTALGAGSRAQGFYTTAMGDSARAYNFASVAIGYQTTASGASSIAIGNAARADHDGSMAFGNGVVAEGQYQIALGNGNHTYRLAGIATDESRNAQSGGTYLITSDQFGRLATSTFDMATLDGLPGRVDQAEQNITTLQTTVNMHATTLDNHETRIVNVEAKNSEQDGRLDQHDATLVDHESRIVENTNTLGLHTTQITDLDGRVTDNTNSIAALDNRITGVESGLADLGATVSDNLREARGGTALALAAASLRYDDRPGKLSIAGGIGHFKGLTGLSFGAGYAASDSFRFNAAVSGVPQQGDIGLSAGVSWTLN